MQIIIGGDLAPTQSNSELFKRADIRMLMDADLLSIWNAADGRIFNLEVPLADEGEAIAKFGPNLIAGKETVNGIKAFNPSLVTLANNHMLDQGIRGLASTTDVLNQNDIRHIGAKDNRAEASKPYIFSAGKLRIGVYACAEYTCSTATENVSGVNLFDPLETPDHIRNLKSRCDYVIVLYHAGKEQYRYPTPSQRRICRKMAQKGADLVVCQHSHCVGCREKYDESTIVYGQGNFLFDRVDNEFWNTSLLIQLQIDDHSFDVEYLPVVKNGAGIKLAQGQEAEDVFSGFMRRSEEMMESGFIERKYSELAEENIAMYLRFLSGFGRLFSALDRMVFNGRLARRKYSLRNVVGIRQFVECETHRQLLLSGLKDIQNSIEKKKHRD